MYLIQFIYYTNLNFIVTCIYLIECVYLKCKINNKGRHVGNIKPSFCQINVDLMGQICEFYAFDKGYFVTCLTDWASFNSWTEILNYQQVKYKIQWPML